MKTLVGFVTLIAAVATIPAYASPQLAQKNACTACHSVDKKLVGPSFRDVAKKYVGQNDASVLLSESIRKGGSGKWGPVPMPAQPNLSEEEARALAEWILSGLK